MITGLELFLIDLGLTNLFADILTKVIVLSVIAALSFIVDLITRKILLNIITKIVKKTKTRWDDILVDTGVFSRIAHITPILVLYYAIPYILSPANSLEGLIQRVLISYMIGIILLILNSFLTAVNTIYSNYNISKTRPIKGYLQIIRVFLSIIAIILIITTILNKSALGLLSGIGALSAVIMLIFKDSILGLVAAIQLSGNDMIRIGDWITVPAHGADGDVIDIKLQTVTIQNFDKTIVNVPIYSLVSSSFKNWRGMSESEGRRIKRHIKIDMNTIKFCSNEMIRCYKKIDLLGDYIESKQREIDEANGLQNVNTSEIINGRRMTNLGVFRAYIEAYLRNHPKINSSMTFLVRQLQPTEKGIPLEIYVFSSDKNWASYENIQADIFDHLLAAVSYFNLAVFQSVSGLDIRENINFVRDSTE